MRRIQRSGGVILGHQIALVGQRSHSRLFGMSGHRSRNQIGVQTGREDAADQVKRLVIKDVI